MEDHEERQEDLNFRPLLATLEATGKHYDIEKIRAAYEYATRLHGDQKRASGEPYITHPVSVAELVVGLGLDTDSVCAALLHDTVEDCGDKTSIPDIQKRFGPEVAMLVEGLTKLVTLNVQDKEEAHMEDLRKMLLAMSKDVRVIFIKLCDRLHNMRTLEYKSEEKQRLKALETMHVYAPLAHRLGIQKIKQELEDLGMRYLDPDGYATVQQYVSEKYGQNAGFMDSVQSMITQKLTECNIHFTLQGRIKTVVSIYNKMYKKGKAFDDIYDFYAVRIIVDTEADCYAVLGHIHEMFKSMPGRFKDYISLPKPNLYRSLHTTVIGRDGIPFEVQIRTWEMHQFNEYGMAAHWKYKTGSASKEEIDKKLQWIANLIETEDGVRDPDEFMNALKIDIFHDEVFVFTPKGDVRSLPSGATVIDFAYAIHSQVGNRMIGAKINGMIVPIDRELNNGEIVEIITSSASHGPSRDWLSIAKTGEARNKIRAWFKREKRAENIVVGRNALDIELKKAAPRLSAAKRQELITAAAMKNGFTNADDLYNIIGYGEMPVYKIMPKVLDELSRYLEEEKPPEPAPEPAPETLPTVQKSRHLRSNSGIIVDGVEGCAIKFARCCNPLPGDEIVGFVTKGYGISIHKRDCPNAVQSMNSPFCGDRWKRARWEQADADVPVKDVYEVTLQIHILDVVGVLADISAALADMRVSVRSINSQKVSNGRAIMNLKIECKNVDHCNSIVSRLRSLENVVDVIRGFN